MHDRLTKIEQFIDSFDLDYFDTPTHTRKSGSKVQFSNSVVSEVSFQNVYGNDKESSFESHYFDKGIINHYHNYLDHSKSNSIARSSENQ